MRWYVATAPTSEPSGLAHPRRQVQHFEIAYSDIVVPKQEPEPVVLLLQRATHRTLDALSTRLAHLRLTPGEINVLTNLVEREEIRVSDLSLRAGTPLTTMTSMLDRLERRDLIVRRTPQSNRRTVMISLTPGGRDVAAKARHAVDSLEDELTASLSTRQLAGLRRTLTLLAETPLSPGSDKESRRQR